MVMPIRVVPPPDVLAAFVKGHFPANTVIGSIGTSRYCRGDLDDKIIAIIDRQTSPYFRVRAGAVRSICDLDTLMKDTAANVVCGYGRAAARCDCYIVCHSGCLGQCQQKPGGFARS
jgi:hypothetical protein